MLDLRLSNIDMYAYASSTIDGGATIDIDAESHGYTMNL